MLKVSRKSRTYYIEVEPLGTRNERGTVSLGGERSRGGLCLATWEACSTAGNIPRTMEQAIDAAEARAEALNLYVRESEEEKAKRLADLDG